MYRRIGYKLAIFLVVGVTALAAEPAEAKKKKKKGKKASMTKITAGAPTLQYERFRRKIEFKVAEKREDQIRGIKRLLELGPPEKELPDLKFRLAELFYEKSRFYWFRGQEAGDKATTAKDKNQKAELLSDKKKNLRESKTWLVQALDIYKEIRDKFPKYERTPEVLFALGQSYWSEGRFQSAIEVYADLIRNFKKSPLVYEAWIAFGEYYFAEGQVNKALRSYENAAKDKRSRVYGFALYKQGWCYYNMSEWKKALRKFQATVIYSQLAEQLSGENKIALGREATKDYVLTFSHVGDARKARFKFADLLAEDNCKGKRCLKMLEQLAGLWYNEGYFDEAVTIYKQLITLNAKNTRNPYFQGRVVELIAKDTTKKKRAIRESKYLVELYQIAKKQVEQGGGGETAKDDIREAAILAETTLRRLAQVWNREAKKTRQPKTYDFAKTMYDEYLRLFPNTKYAYEMRFQLGDLFYKLEKFDKAAKMYETTVLADPKGKYLVDAANDNILAVEEHIKDLRIKTPKPANKPRKIHPQKQRLIKACDLYIQNVNVDNAPKKLKAKVPAKIVTVKFKAAKIYYDYSHYDVALGRFDKIVTNHPRADQAKFAANLVIDVYNLRKDWDRLYESAARYLKMADLIEGRAQLRQDLEKFAEYAKFALVQALEKRVQKERGDVRLVADKYEEFYQEFPRSENADKAVYNASVLRDKVGQKDRADELRRILLTKYKNSSLTAEVAFYVAKRDEDRTEYASAAKGYLNFARNHPGDKRARDAMYNAAVFFAGVGSVKLANKLRVEYLNKFGKTKGGEKEASELYYAIAKDLDQARRWREAVKRYDEYARKFPKTEKAWDARWREAQIRRTKLRQRSAADKLEKKLLGNFNYLVRKRKKVPENAKRYASQVAFKLVDEELGKYRRLRVRTPNLRNPKPFQKSLKEKAKARTKLIKQYTQVVTRYQQAESTISSLFRIAQSWDEFVSTLGKVPCPRGIPQEACMQIKEGIDQMAAPAREAAYAAYKTCVQKSTELNTFTRHSTLCVKALETLAPADFPPIVEKSLDYQAEPRIQNLQSNDLILDFDGYRAAEQKKPAVAKNGGEPAAPGGM